MREFCFSIVACLFSASAVSSDAGGSIKVVNVGNEPNYSMVASGIAVANVYQGNCKYSIDLGSNQYIKFNTPDVVFLESKTFPGNKDWPRLEQAEMSAGYDWKFKKDRDPKSKWFGLMCDGIDSFDLAKPAGASASEDISPELEDVRQANGLKCPATLNSKGLVPNKNAGRPEDYVYEEITGSGWSGIIFGFKDKGHEKIARVSFCIVQGENVLVGAAENYPSPLTIDLHTFEGVRDILSSIKFLP